jgi:riboflavin kinase/FMN adenylyltransferase
VRVLRFTPAFAEKGAERFLAEHAFPFAPLAVLVVGYDFAMGHAREGSLDVLRTLGSRLGFAVHEVPAVLDRGEPISSTRVRHVLAAGDVLAATRLLGRPYTLTGTVVQGDGRGRSLGFPTANLDAPATRLRPAAGVYAVWVQGIGASVHRGVANVGIRPTFGGGGERLEVHLFDLDRDLVGTRLVVAFAARLRPEIKFNGPRELQRQIAEDAAQARGLLAGMDPDRPAGAQPNPP